MTIPAVRLPSGSPKEGYRIFFNTSGFIEIAFIGPQTPDTIEAMLAAARLYNDAAVAQGRPVKYLMDNKLIGKTSIATNQRAARALKELSYEKMASINASPVVRLIVNAMSRLAGRSRRVRQFSSRKEAEAWLLEP